MKSLIKIGGTLLDDAESRNQIARQVAEIAATGIRLTVVHGGGKQMTRFLEERGLRSRFIRGLRVTTEQTIDAVLKVLAGTVNTELVAALCAAGVKAAGLTGIDSGLAVAEQLDPELGFVGRVARSDSGLLDTLTGAGYVPVVACVAGGAGGEIFNVNADSMAVAVASAWQADRLVFLTDVAGVLDAGRSVIPVLTADTCRELIASEIATGGMLAKLDAAMTAVAHGVQEVRVVKGCDPAVLKRVFAGEAIGTSVLPSLAEVHTS